MIPDILVYSLLASLMTIIGSLIAYLFPINHRVIAFSFGFSSGMMLYLSYFSLLPAAIKLGGLRAVLIGIISSLLMMWLIHQLSTEPKPTGCNHLPLERIRFFFILAVIAHHLPEGIAVGAGFEVEHHMGVLLVLAFAIHNLPEGMALAFSLISSGRSPINVLGWSLFCGLTLPLGTWLGITYLNQSLYGISIGLTFAATTMLWVVINEIFPKAYQFHRKLSLVGLIVGGILIDMIH